MDLALLDAPRREHLTVKRSLLHQQKLTVDAPSTANEPPYHYHAQALAMDVGGWIFPAPWQFSHNALLDILFALRVERIKGVMHTDSGWLNINVTSQDASFNSRAAGADNRLEIISHTPVDWPVVEAALMAIRLGMD